MLRFASRFSDHFRAACAGAAGALPTCKALVAALSLLPAVPAIADAITYQGRLDVMGEPANGEFDLRFALAYSPNGDSNLQVIHLDDVPVADGLFSVELDFQEAYFNGNPRWILVSVRPGSAPNGDHSPGSYTPLLPWQQVRPAPMAIYADRAGDLNLPIDAEANLLGVAGVKVRNDVSTALAGHSDNGTGVYAETRSGTAVMAQAIEPTGWAATLHGRVYVHDALGIGTSSLGGLKLAVNGSAAKPGGGSWSALSDRRTKRAIQPISGALGTLLSLQGVTFEYEPQWIEQGLALPGKQMGFIAQEVQEVLPDWVESRDDGTLYVTERGATALIVEALRELDQRRAAAEAELSALRAQVEDLSRRLEALTAGAAGAGGCGGM